MTIIAIGQVCNAKGLCQGIDGAGAPVPYDMPAPAYLRHQPSPMPVFFDHDQTWKLGEVVHLERSRSQGLMAVMSITADIESLLRDHEWRISDGVAFRRMGVMEMGQVKIRELSLVGRTENLNTAPVRWSHSETPPGNMPLRWYDTWHAAVERLSSRHRRADVMDIVDLDPVDEVRTDPDAALAGARAFVDAAKARSAPSGARPKAPLVVDPVLHRRSAGPRVSYFGVELEGAAAQRVLDEWMEGCLAGRHGTP